MKLITYSWNGVGNLGDDWISKSVLDHLRSEGFEANCITEPQSLNVDSKVGDLQWVRFTKTFVDVIRLRRKLRDYDAMIFAGGGWFAGDQNLRNSLMWLLRVILCPIPIYTLGIGVGPFNGSCQHFIFRLIAKRIRNFDVRHILDATHLSFLGITDFTVSADLTFLEPIEPTISKAINRENCLVILPAFARHRSIENLEKTGERILKHLHSLEILDSQIFFVSFQLSPHDDYSSWCEIFPKHLVVGNSVEIAKVFSSAKYVVAGRLHAALAACRYEVPNICVIPYHEKFQILTEMGITIPKSYEENLEFGMPNISSYRDRHFALAECVEVIVNRISIDLVRRA